MKPINLKNLPDYLRKLRDENRTDDSLVVDMGKITNQNSYRQALKFGTMFSICLIFIVGFLEYKKIINKNNIIIMEVKEEIKKTEDIEKIALEFGGVVSTNKNNIYEIKVDRSKNINLLVEKLKRNIDIKKIDIK